MTRALALDVGRVRIGVAISDEERLIAQPHSVLVRRGRNKDIPAIANLCRELDVSTVIIGLPLRVDGTMTSMAEEIDRFRRRLKSALPPDIEVVAWDESMTTVDAEALLREKGLRGKRQRKVVDQVAAAVLLESFLEAQRETIKNTPERGLKAPENKAE